MYALSATQLIKLWEESQAQNPAERILSILETAMPDMPREKLAQISIGTSNTYLLKIHESNFGAQLECFTKCPQCGEALEFSLNSQAMYDLKQIQHEYNLQINAFDLHYRLLNNHDLLIAAQQASLEKAKQYLLESCLLQVVKNGKAVAVTELPDAVINQFMEALQNQDPQAVILINLTCPNCAHQWQGLLDVMNFIIAQIEIRAKQLLADVHQIAMAYGWQEAAIIAMSNKKRRYYLERIS